jgi:hypothetical protein
MRRLPIQSRSLKSLGYDEEKKILEVEFHSGAVYQYTGVTKELLFKLVKAPSRGRFFNEHIREHYPTRKVI